MDPDKSTPRKGGLLTPLFGGSSTQTGDISQLYHIQQQLFLLLDAGDPKERHKEVTALLAELKQCKKKSGIDCIRANEAGEHVMHIAILRNREDVVAALLQSSLGMPMLQSGNPRPLILAAEYGCLDIIEIIYKHLKEKGKLTHLKDHDEDKNTALHKATHKKQYATVQRLLVLGADFTIKNSADKTPVECTSDHKMLRIYKPFVERYHSKMNAKYGKQVSMAILAGALRPKKSQEMAKSPPAETDCMKSPLSQRISTDGIQRYLNAIMLLRFINQSLGLEEDLTAHYAPRKSFVNDDQDGESDEFHSAAYGDDSDLETFPPANDDDDDFFFGEMDDDDNGAGMGMSLN